MFDYLSFIKVFYTFIIFCLTASSVYLLNDVIDKETDKNHPTKKEKPIAKGEISVNFALLISLILLVISLFWSLKISKGLVYFVLAYYLFNLFYSLVLKHLLLIDVFSVAFNYLIRVYAGAYVLKVGISQWLFLIVFLFSLVVNFGKRKEELVLLEEQTENHRKTLGIYTEDLLNQMIIITSTLSIICYILYTVAPETINKHGPYLVYSTPLVVFGFLRYLYLVNKEKMGSPVEVFLKDKNLFFTVLVWGLLILGLIYFF